MQLMTSWKPTPRQPAKTKAELREMLAEAVRNTQPQTEAKPLPKAKKRRGTH
jgi:predicted Zn-dependent peptidase